MNEEFYTNVRQYGNKILYVGYDSDNKRIQKSINFKPVLYVNCKDNNPDAYSYDGSPLKKFEQADINEAKDFVKNYKNVSGFSLYGMDKFNYQYISRKFKHGEVPYRTDIIRIFYFDIEVYSGNGFPDPFEAKEEITCISLKDVKENKMHVWTLKNRYNNQRFDPNNLQYISEDELTFELVLHEFDNERDMLSDFMFFYSTNPPDVLSGWYSRHFDIPYIFNRISNVLGKKAAKNLSPFSIVNEQTKNVKKFGTYREEKTYDIYGISELDYQDLYRKYTFVKSPSYSLDYITKKHLNKGKIEYDGTLHELLMSDYQKYVEYNIIDVQRIHELDEELKFMDLIIDVSYSGKVAMFSDALGTVKYWEMLIYNHLNEKNIQPQLKQFEEKSDKQDQYAGAFVKSPYVGKHNWVVSFDLASLYPNVIRQVNIGPETKVSAPTNGIQEYLDNLTPGDLIHKKANLNKITDNYDLSISGNAKLYTKEYQSFFSELMEKFFNKRKVYKKKMMDAEQEYNKTKSEESKHEKSVYHTKQLATKILINSAYGAIGNQYFQYYDIDNAEAVTVTGQVIIQWIESRMNNYLNNLLKDYEEKDRIVYIDTDSIYICLDDLVDSIFKNDKSDIQKIVTFLDNVAKKKLEPFIQSCYNNLFNYMNHYENHMEMDREIISDVAVWTGKKRYFMNVWDKEGVRYSEPDMKVLGIEVVKSSTPQICRQKLEDALEIILRKDEDTLIKFIDDFKKEFKQLKPEEVAFPRGTNELNKWIDSKGNFKSGVPIHVRGVLIHNKILKKEKLTKKYDTIYEGQDILFTYMKMPNALHENIFAFSEKIPKDLDEKYKISEYVDYDEQFEKAFVTPLKAITDIIEWKTEKKNDLSAFFA